jgi:hypothetical protein
MQYYEGTYGKSICYRYIARCDFDKLHAIAKPNVSRGWTSQHKVPPPLQIVAFAMICSGRDDRVWGNWASPLKPKSGLSGPPSLPTPRPVLPNASYERASSSRRICR